MKLISAFIDVLFYCLLQDETEVKLELMLLQPILGILPRPLPGKGLGSLA